MASEPLVHRHESGFLNLHGQIVRATKLCGLVIDTALIIAKADLPVDYEPCPRCGLRSVARQSDP
ncbi:MAG TPA: hypothetical protein VLE93_03060 [Candidatus Saccharimonadales bacterium]|nr:hypothetical protein [Candidatus Saccharimonadales bacterium]